MQEVGELRALVKEATDAAGTREEDSRRSTCGEYDLPFFA